MYTGFYFGILPLLKTKKKKENELLLNFSFFLFYFVLDVPLEVNMFVELIGAVQQNHGVKSCERRGCHGNDDTHKTTRKRRKRNVRVSVHREIRLNKMHAPTPETNRRYSNESNIRAGHSTVHSYLSLSDKY